MSGTASRICFWRFLMRRLSHISGRKKPRAPSAPAPTMPNMGLPVSRPNAKKPTPRMAGHDQLQAEEVDRPQIARVAGHRQPRLGAADLLWAGEALGHAGESHGEWAQRALEERLLKLDLLEGPRLHGAEL